jgi:hypothetical protein
MKTILLEARMKIPLLRPLGLLRRLGLEMNKLLFSMTQRISMSNIL